MEESLETRVLRHGWRLEAIDGWRHDDVDPALADFNARLARLERNDVVDEAVKDAVAAYVTKRDRGKLTRWQLTGLWVGIGATVATAIQSWVR